MAAKMIKLPENAKSFGVEKFIEYAKEHGFRAFCETYKIVRKHSKSKMKNIDLYTRQRISSPREEFCEVMKVETTRRNGDVILGYLVGYHNGIRFDAHEKY